MRSDEKIHPTRNRVAHNDFTLVLQDQIEVAQKDVMGPSVLEDDWFREDMGPALLLPSVSWTEYHTGITKARNNIVLGSGEAIGGAGDGGIALKQPFLIVIAASLWY